MTRRQLLIRGGLAGGGVLLAPVAVLARDTEELGPSLPALPLLPVRRPEPGLVTAELSAGELPARAGGARRLGYSGSTPGPLIHVREGEHVRLGFTNGLREATNLHLHGLRIAPAVDAPFTHLEPGERRMYEFDVPAASAGTYWYHAHPHGMVARQVGAGLLGGLVVDGPLDEERELEAAEQHVVVLSSLSTRPELLVNGARRPHIRARGATLRLRLINAHGSRSLRLALDEPRAPWADRRAPLHLIASDGGLLRSPVEMEELLLAPGGRAEALVRLEREAPLQLRTLDYSPYRDGSAADAGEVLMHLLPPPRPQPAALPTRLASPTALAPPRGARPQLVEFGADADGMFTINERSFAADRVDMRARQGELAVWELVNTDAQDHPFHLHSWSFQVLSRNGRPDRIPAWRDTVTLRPDERMRIAIPFSDFAGRTVFHCHVLSHEDMGMMGVLDVSRARS